MDKLKEKVEAMNQKLEDEDARSEELEAAIRNAQKREEDNMLEVERIKRKMKKVTEDIKTTNEKVDEIENEVLKVTDRDEQNRNVIETLEVDEEDTDDKLARLEAQLSDAKAFDMELSGKMEHSRSRKKLLEGELKKVQEMRIAYEEQCVELQRSLSLQNARVEQLTSELSDGDGSEIELTARKKLEEETEAMELRQMNAKQEFVSIEQEVNQLMAEIERVQANRHSTERELKQMIDDLNSI